MVGKVTVAMLERNLVRLFEQFHHPAIVKAAAAMKRREELWYGNPLNLYIALAVTALLLLEVARKA